MHCSVANPLVSNSDISGKQRSLNERQAYVLDVHFGKSYLPMSKRQRLFVSLRERWSHSIVRRVVAERRNLPHRIRELQSVPYLRFGSRVSPYPPRRPSAAPCLSRHKYVHAGSDDMQPLQAKHPRIGMPDLQVCAQAFQRAAEWAHGTFYSGIDTVMAYSDPPIAAILRCPGQEIEQQHTFSPLTALFLHKARPIAACLYFLLHTCAVVSFTAKRG